MSVNDYSDAVYNFILSQKLTALLGNFPEVTILIGLEVFFGEFDLFSRHGFILRCICLIYGYIYSIL